MPKSNPLPLPHMWLIPKWPADVWPFTETKARTLIRFRKDELVRAGALVRPGQQLVVLGPQYLGWLQRQGARVDDYTIAPNRGRKAASINSAAS